MNAAVSARVSSISATQTGPPIVGSAAATGAPSRSGRSLAGSQVREPSLGTVIGRSREETARDDPATPPRQRAAPGRQDGAMIGQLHSVVIDAPDPHALATFYAGVLDMEIKGGPGDDWVTATGAGYR